MTDVSMRWCRSLVRPTPKTKGGAPILFHRSLKLMTVYRLRLTAEAFHDFFFFGGGELFDFLGFSVGELFEFVERALLLVLADFLVLLEFVDGFLDVAADIADRGAVIFERLVDVLDE